MQCSGIGPFLWNLVVKLLTKHKSGSSTMATAVVFYSLADHLFPVRSVKHSAASGASLLFHPSPYGLYAISKIQFCRGTSHAFAKPEILFQALLYLLLWSSFLSSCLTAHVSPASFLHPFSFLKIFLFSLFLSLWCSVSCKHRKRQCSLSPFLMCFVVWGEQSRAGPCARCLCSRKPLINTDFACLSVTAAIQSTPFSHFFFCLLFFIWYILISSFLCFFFSFISLFFLFKGTKLGQLAWTPKTHHAPLYPPNPLATFTQISQQLKIENNKKHGNHSITRTTQSL